MRRRDFIKNTIIGGAWYGVGAGEFPLRAGCAAAATSEEGVPLERLQFRNSGMVAWDMRFEYFDQPLAYAEDVDHWNTSGRALYLYEAKEGRKMDPPSGMRSSVPLGGLGAGTVELRADGTLCDWEIFNNSPASGAKIQLDDVFFGLWAKRRGRPARALALRTRPLRALPTVSQIEYAGAFPLSRLRFSDPSLPLSVELYAYGEFRPFGEEFSGTPCALFTFILHNAARERVEASLLFNLRNYAKGSATCGRWLRFERRGTDPASGTLAVKVAGEGVLVTSAAKTNLQALWDEFSVGGDFNGEVAPEEVPDYGAVAAKTGLGAGELRTITFALAWYLPNGRYKSQTPGNHYTALYRSADDVADTALRSLPSSWAAMDAWPRTMFRNSLPAWLQDALVNSVATLYKTGVWFGDGRFRQYESFSCAGLNPGHIDFYRILPYAFFFPGLNRNLLLAHAESQQPDGFIPEQLTTGCFTPDSELGQPGGRVMGDSETVFLLWAWQIYAWTGDRQYLDRVWENVKKAAAWQMRHSAKYGLPERMDNTYDWWRFGEKDLVAYNAFLHLAAMRAAERLAQVEGDADLARQYRQAFETGQASLREHLWTGAYFRSWWMEGKPYPDALHADTLYGQLWAFLLDLGLTADESQLKQHLEMEARLNSSPFGLKVMRRADPDHPGAEEAVPSAGGVPAARDNLVWQAGSLDWCALSLYLGRPVEESLAEAEKIVRHWADRLRDQWDYTDLTTGWDGYPWCNSHYARQVILWSIPLALSGQRYFAPAGRLSFDPRLEAPARLPFFTPTAFGTAELLGNGRCRLGVDFGKLDLRELRIGKAALRRPISLRAGEQVSLREG
jgi:uncharacterized protein (DUF608 family)